MIRREHVAEREPAATLARPHGNGADGLVRSRLGREDKREAKARAIRRARLEDETRRLALWQGMGHAARHFGDALLAAVAGDRLDVGEARPAQPEPRGLDREHVVAHEVGEGRFGRR